MDFLHAEYDLGPNDVVRVTLDKAANVRLFDTPNFQRFRRGERCEFYGGEAQVSPCHLSPPRFDRWHVVIDLGGRAGTIRHGIQILRG
jgi:hypothetical protein